MFQYLGLDWLAMVLTFSAIYLLGNKSRVGFLIMILGNVHWRTMTPNSSLDMDVPHGRLLPRTTAQEFPPAYRRTERKINLPKGDRAWLAHFPNSLEASS
jgi:hypothetical protein